MLTISVGVITGVVTLARFLPQHVFEGRSLFNLSQERTVRVWEEVMSLLWYIINVGCMIAIRVSPHFFFSAPLILDPSDVDSPEFEGVRRLLVANISYYVGMLVVACWKPRRRDWLEMATHHVITIGLMLVAYIVGFYDVSIFVLFINGLSDIFLSASRIAYDAEHPAQTPLFAVFVVLHLALRVVFYPIKTWWCFYLSIGRLTTFFGYLPGLCTVPLWLLYLFWTPKILKVCWRRLVHGDRDVDKSVRKKKAK